MYSPINPEAYLRIRADETRRAVQRARFRAAARRHRDQEHHRAP
jgi:hypothetical protein